MTKTPPNMKHGQFFNRSKSQLQQNSELLKIGYPSLQQQQLSVTFGALTVSPPQSPIMSTATDNRYKSNRELANLKTFKTSTLTKETPASQAFPSYCTVCDTLIDPTAYSPLYCSDICREKDSNSTGKIMPAKSLLLARNSADVDDDHINLDEFDFINLNQSKVSPMSSARESLASLEISSRESMSSFASSKRFGGLGPGGTFRPPSEPFYSPVLSPHQQPQHDDLDLIPDIAFLSSTYGQGPVGDLVLPTYPNRGHTRHSNPVVGSENKTALLHRKYSSPAVVSTSSSCASVLSTRSADMGSSTINNASGHNNRLSSSTSSSETATGVSVGEVGEGSVGGTGAAGAAGHGVHRPRRQSFYIRSGKHLYSSANGTPTSVPTTPQISGPSQFAKQLGLSGDSAVPCKRLSTNGAYFYPESPRSINLVLPQQPPSPISHDFEYEFPRVKPSKNGTLPTRSSIRS